MGIYGETEKPWTGQRSINESSVASMYEHHMWIVYVYGIRLQILNIMRKSFAKNVNSLSIYTIWWNPIKNYLTWKVTTVLELIWSTDICFLACKVNSSHVDTNFWNVMVAVHKVISLRSPVSIPYPACQQALLIRDLQLQQSVCFRALVGKHN